MHTKLSSYLIYVPQARSARFIRSTTEFYDIDGGYVDDFTTCNIVACIGGDRFTLTHADSATDLEVLKKEIQWVGQPNRLMIINRAQGVMLEEKIINHFKKEYPHIEVKKVDTEDYGLAIYLTASSQTPHAHLDHPQIQLFSHKQSPKNLLHHPLEEKFSSVSMIKLFIRECFLNAPEPFATVSRESYGALQQVIFDGYAWEALDQSQLQLPSSVQQVLPSFGIQKTDSEIEIITKLENMIKKIHPSVDQKKIFRVVANTAPCISNYLNNFDAEYIFKSSIIKLIKKLENSPTLTPSSADKKFTKDFKDTINKPNSGFNEIDALIMQFKTTAQQSEYKPLILEAHEDVLRVHYYARLPYKKIEIANAAYLTLIEDKNRHVVTHCNAKEYKLAQPIALEVLKLATLCCLKDVSKLATAYYNYGKILNYNEKVEDAAHFLTICLNLKKNMLKPNQKEIMQVETALTVCQNKMALSQSNSSTSFTSILSKALLNKSQTTATPTDSTLSTATDTTVAGNIATTNTTTEQESKGSTLS